MTSFLRFCSMLLIAAFLQNVSHAQLTELKDSITADLKLDSTKQYLLKGFFKVKSGATITIPPGTVIFGDKTTKGSLIIERGAKIIANGTPKHPIVFTSANAPGSRVTGDWGGILIAGNASVNIPGGIGTFEGGVGVQYGGGASPNDDDNSGILRYVRIEYSGIPFVPNSEINGLTMGGVGRGTIIEYVAIIENGDDSFEWFGGTVNGKYLISTKPVDDDFDTDFGFRGKLQYVIAHRNPSIADVSGSHAMEADNDGTGSLNSPRSNPTISNATFVGPMQDTGATGWNPNFKRGGHWRRSTQYGLHNSIVMGWPVGLLIDGKNTTTAAQGDTLTVLNSIFAGNKKRYDTTSSNGTFDIAAWATAAPKGNTFLMQPADAMLMNPFDQTNPDFLPKSGSPALSGASYAHPRVQDNYFGKSDFRGAMGLVDWTKGWMVWNPQNVIYTSPYTITSPAITVVELKDSITTDLKLDSTKHYLLKGFFKVKSGAKITIPAGTVVMGDKTTKGSLIIERGAQIFAQGTKTHPIVFTSANAPGSRVTGDWGGILIAGNASVNIPGGVGTFEGGVGVQYGGGASPNDNDNSGVLRYVRIEYSGIPFVPNSEINGLTMGGVGRGTTIEYVMITENGDDSFEWFGGTVNGKYLISTKPVDDDFDTDFGFRGKLQYVIAHRNPSIADVSGSHAMEADNDGTGSLNGPRSNPTISNATFVGPMQTTAATGFNPNFKRGSHWRRSTQYGLHNSIVMGWPVGIFIDGKNTTTAAQGDSLTLRNTIMAGNKKQFDTTSSNGTFDITAWATDAAKGNTIAAEPADAMLMNPFDQNNPDFLPKIGSPALSGSGFTHPRVADPFFTATSYRGAMGKSDWTRGWAVWNPQHVVYSAPYSVDPMIPTGVKHPAAAAVPEQYLLSQNYPNPFNPSTMINFSVPVSGSVSLKVYDMVGREVATMVDGFTAAGNYTVSFDASQLSSGMYFYKLQSGSFSQVKKMLLVK